jgi:hypothetical protein
MKEVTCAGRDQVIPIDKELRGWAGRPNLFAGGVTRSRSALSNLALCVYYWSMLKCSLNPRIRRSVWIAVGFFCCALLAFTGIVQVGHSHADGQAVQSDCALCHTAHLVVQTPIPQSLPHSVWVVEATAATLQPIRLRHISVFSLFTRPPPVDIAFA